jgi:ketosteroid isomerase-like protein
VTERPRFEALAPFFRIIEEGLSGIVDGEDFFDTLAEDAVFEYVISVPGYPRRVVGREAVAELYRGYGQTMVLHGSDELAVHHDRKASVVVLEYAVHGRAIGTGHAYDNHFCLRPHDQGPQDHTLARLPRPRRRIRCAWLAEC